MPESETLLPVRVTVRAKKERIEISEGVVKVWVSVAPVDGRANERVIEILANRLDVPKSAITIVRGPSTRSKTVSVRGLSQREIQLRLQP